MKLFLTSSTITRGLVEPFEELSKKKINRLKVAFVPDAGFGVPEKKGLSWIDKERQFLVDSYKWKITDVVLRDIKKVDIDLLSKQDVVFVNGGFSGYLAKEMRRTEFDKALPRLLKKNIVYVGSSGGSMVMSDVQDTASWYINEPEPEAKDIPGLGYINFQIYPHIKLGLVDMIKKKRDKKLSYLLLKDGQAISVKNGVITTHGGEVMFLPSK